MRKQKITKIVVYFQITNLLISIIVGNWADHQIKFFRHGYQTWSFLTSNIGSFDDFYGDRFEKLGDYYHWREYTQAPITNIIGKFYYFIPDRTSIVFFALFNVLVIVFILNLLKTKNINLNIFLVIVSYPFFFALFRGNNDIYLLPWLLIILFFHLNQRHLAVGFFAGLMIGLEPITALFIIVFFLNFRFKQISMYFLGAGLALTLPLLYGEKNISKYYQIASSFTNDYYFPTMVLNNGGLLFNNSLFGFAKYLFFQLKINRGLRVDEISENVANYLINPYFILTIFMGIIFVVFLILLSSNLDRVNVLISMMILLPYVAAAYKLVMLTFLLFCYLNYSDLRARKNLITILYLSLIVIPKNYIWIQFSFDPTGMTIESILNPILIFLMVISIILNSKKSIKNVEAIDSLTTFFNKRVRKPSI
jgi:hypothetical protein